MSDHMKQIVLPIIGMTCANCVATLERASKKLEGVDDAVFNLANEHGMIEYDPETVTLEDLIQRIERYGYKVATGSIRFTFDKPLRDVQSEKLKAIYTSVEGIRSLQIDKDGITFETIPTMVRKKHYSISPQKKVSP